MSMSETDRIERIWSIYQEIGTIERHFNDLQATYRTMGAGWILALFAALGFLMFPSTTPPIEPNPALGYIALIGAIAAIGIIILWIIDLLVYHRLLLAAFFAGQKLEEDNLWLPPIRINMSKLHEKYSVTDKVIIFYAFGAGLSFGISVAASNEYWNIWRPFDITLLPAAVISIIVFCALFYRVGLLISGDVKTLRECVENRSIVPTVFGQ